ncbi:MAG: hypothetical protein LUC93_16680, partial [Planctomycetaceae bacterium]|nr:hypothetical protein [Planctomycetaceae bacterium]
QAQNYPACSLLHSDAADDTNILIHEGHLQNKARGSGAGFNPMIQKIPRDFFPRSNYMKIVPRGKKNLLSDGDIMPHPVSPNP